MAFFLYLIAGMGVKGAERGDRYTLNHATVWERSRVGCNTHAGQGYVLACQDALLLSHAASTCIAFQWGMNTNNKILAQKCFFPHNVTQSDSEKDQFVEVQVFFMLLRMTH